MSDPILRADLAQTLLVPKPAKGRRTRLAFYSHDSMGMGHIRRNLLIATAVVRQCPDVEVLLLAGTREAAYFATQAGLDCVTLPAIGKSNDGRYSARNLDWSLEDTIRLRSRIIQAAMEEFQPDVFVADKLPRGIGHELTSTLKQLRSKGTRCVLGLRDVLDEPNVVAQEWSRDGNDEAIEAFYDELWIYGDQSIYDCLKEYRFTSSVCSRAFFTGYLNQSTRHSAAAPSEAIAPHAEVNRSDRENRQVLCVVGGGQDGFQLARAFALTMLPPHWQGTIITGPLMPKEEQRQLHLLASVNQQIEVIDRLVETDDYLQSADRVIAMGGYNTVTSILSYKKAALIVPRISPRQEQWIRAERLAKLGLLSVLRPDEMNQHRLSEWLHTDSVAQPSAGSIDLAGLNRISQRVSLWAQQRTDVAV